jgi:hypothetical protein
VTSRLKTSEGFPTYRRHARACIYGDNRKSLQRSSDDLNGGAGALTGPVTAFIYDWNMLSLGQLLWLKELETYKRFPPPQSPESWNLDQVTEQIRNGMGHPSQ